MADAGDKSARSGPGLGPPGGPLPWVTFAVATYLSLRQSEATLLEWVVCLGLVVAMALREPPAANLVSVALRWGHGLVQGSRQRWGAARTGARTAVSVAALAVVATPIMVLRPWTAPPVVPSPPRLTVGTHLDDSAAVVDSSLDLEIDATLTTDSARPIDLGATSFQCMVRNESRELEWEVALQAGHVLKQGRAVPNEAHLVGVLDLLAAAHPAERRGRYRVTVAADVDGARFAEDDMTFSFGLEESFSDLRRAEIATPSLWSCDGEQFTADVSEHGGYTRAKLYPSLPAQVPLSISGRMTVGTSEDDSGPGPDSDGPAGVVAAGLWFTVEFCDGARGAISIRVWDEPAPAGRRLVDDLTIRYGEPFDYTITVEPTADGRWNVIVAVDGQFALERRIDHDPSRVSWRPTFWAEHGEVSWDHYTVDLH